MKKKVFEQLQDVLQTTLALGGMPDAAKLDLIRATMHSLILFAEHNGADFSDDADTEGEMIEFFSTTTGAQTAEKFARLIGTIVRQLDDEEDEREETPLRIPKGFDLSRN